MPTQTPSPAAWEVALETSERENGTEYSKRSFRAGFEAGNALTEEQLQAVKGALGAVRGLICGNPDCRDADCGVLRQIDDALSQAFQLEASE